MDKKEALEHFVAHLQAINRHLRHASHSRTPQPVTRVQWLLLRHLRRRESCTIGQLAEHLNVRSSTMSQMIDRLEKAGLVSRGTDADDARVKMVCLTESGMDMIRQSEAQWIEELSGPFDHFSDQEREQLVDLISRLHAYMRESG